MKRIRLLLTIGWLVIFFPTAVFALDGKPSTAELFAAVEFGWTEVAKNEISKGVEVNRTNSEGLTPLLLASRKGYGEIVKLLLEAGADVEAKTGGDNNLTSLQIASEKGDAAVVQLLLDANALTDSDTFEFSPLFLAAKSGCSECVRMLLENGADVNSTTHRRKIPPLYVAISSGSLPAVKMLLEKGADVNRLNPLLMASKQGQTEIVEMLLTLPKIDVNTADTKGFTPLMYASLYGYTEIVKLLLEKGADVNAAATNSAGVKHTPLSLAKLKGHSETVKLLESSLNRSH